MNFMKLSLDTKVKALGKDKKSLPNKFIRTNIGIKWDIFTKNWLILMNILKN